jgi:hypothetical protein
MFKKICMVDGGDQLCRVAAVQSSNLSRVARAGDVNPMEKTHV